MLTSTIVQQVIICLVCGANTLEIALNGSAQSQMIKSITIIPISTGTGADIKKQSTTAIVPTTGQMKRIQYKYLSTITLSFRGKVCYFIQQTLILRHFWPLSKLQNQLWNGFLTIFATGYEIFSEWFGNNFQNSSRTIFE